MPNNVNPADKLFISKINAGFAGSTVAALFPLDKNNISIDRSLFLAGISGCAGEYAGKSNNDYQSSMAFTFNGISSAFIYKMFDEYSPTLQHTVFLFLAASLAPAFLEEGANKTCKIARNLFNWWNRPDPQDYELVNQVDEENQISLP